MKKKTEPAQTTTVFILLKESAKDIFEKLEADIEEIDGSVRHAFPPRLLIAELPAGRIDQLKQNRHIQFLTAVAINPEQPPFAEAEFPGFMALWNNYLQHRGKPPEKTKENLSWDTPGFLPPDPPPPIRAMMREWEEQMKRASGKK